MSKYSLIQPVDLRPVLRGRYEGAHDAIQDAVFLKNLSEKRPRRPRLTEERRGGQAKKREDTYPDQVRVVRPQSVVDVEIEVEACPSIARLHWTGSCKPHILSK